MLRKLSWLILLAVASTACLFVPNPSSADAAESKTNISFVGDRYWLRASLDGLWQYQAGDEIGGWIIIQRKERGPASSKRRMQTFRITGRQFPDNPEELTTKWAAEADWFVATMRYSNDEGWGNEAKKKMPKAKLRALDIFGHRLFTHRAKLRMTRDVSMHLFYYILFPDQFPEDRAYYGFEYLDFRHRKAEKAVSASSLHDVISGFSFDVAKAPSESTVSWSLHGNEHVVINALEQGRTFYFNNNHLRQCFAFSQDGLWYATDEPGLLGISDDEGFIGVLLLSEEDVQDFEGDDFLSRVASSQQHRQGETAEKTAIEDFDCCIPNAIRSTGSWTVKGKRSVMAEKVQKTFEEDQEVVLKRVRYIAEVKPGWAAVVTASYTVGGDEMARSIFESLRFSDAPDCFNDEIAKLSL